MQMEDYLCLKDLYLSLGEKPDLMDEKEWNFLDCKVLDVIRLALSKLVAFNIKNKNTTTSLMVAVTSMYKQPFAANKVHQIKRLFNLKIPKNENSKQYLNEFNEIMNQLNSIDIKFDDEIQAPLILDKLPKSWKDIITLINGLLRKSKLVFSEVVDMIIDCRDQEA